MRKISIGPLIRSRRRARNMTLQELAKRVKPCSVSHLSQIERNAVPDLDGTPQRPSIDLLDRVAVALDIPLAEARLAADYPLPISDEDALVVEIAANAREIPPDAQRIVLTQVRAVREMYAAEGKANSGTSKKGAKKAAKKAPSKGVAPGDPDWAEPVGESTPPPRRKKPGEGEPPQEKHGRRTA